MNTRECILDRLMAEKFHVQRELDSGGVDYVETSGGNVFDVKLRKQGMRDLRDAMLQVASYIGSATRPINRGYVMISLARSSPNRVWEEWRAAKKAMLPTIAQRLCLIAVVQRQIVTEPDDPETHAIAEWFRTIVARMEWRETTWAFEGTEPWPAAAAARQVYTSWKHLEIEKILLHRWLLRKGEIAIGELQTKVGCSYPTVQQVIKTMDDKGLIHRGIGRSVGLMKYPRDSWATLIASAEHIYAPLEFVDVTGETGSAAALLDRLRHHPKLATTELAIGGVAAARYWDPDFDLNGMPRLDLILHAPISQEQSQNIDQGFIRLLDPALAIRRGEHAHRSPVLVVHTIHRADSLFMQDPEQPLPWADPVETVLHLYELGLTVQASDFVSRLRSRAVSPESQIRNEPWLR